MTARSARRDATLHQWPAPKPVAMETGEAVATLRAYLEWQASPDSLHRSPKCSRVRMVAAVGIAVEFIENYMGKGIGR